MLKNEIILSIYLQPGAKKSEVSDVSPSVDSKANEAPILFFDSNHPHIFFPVCLVFIRYIFIAKIINILNKKP